MTRPATLSTSAFTLVRSISGVIAADSTTLTDANIPPASALDCRGYETIFVCVEITGGSSPTATLEVLIRDPDATDGSRWKRILVGSPDGVTPGAAASQKTSALDGTSLYEVRVFGHEKVFLRVDAVTNSGSTTAMKILAIPGKTRASWPN